MPNVWERPFPDMLSCWHVVKEPIGFGDVIRGTLYLHLPREARGEFFPFSVCESITLPETAFVADNQIERPGSRPTVVEPVAEDFDGILLETGSLPIHYGGTVFIFGLH